MGAKTIRCSLHQDGTWEPYPFCSGDIRETRDGCDPCPGPFGGERNRTLEQALNGIQHQGGGGGGGKPGKPAGSRPRPSSRRPSPGIAAPAAAAPAPFRVTVPAQPARSTAQRPRQSQASAVAAAAAAAAQKKAPTVIQARSRLIITESYAIRFPSPLP